MRFRYGSTRGFTGELVLSQTMIDEMQFPMTGTIEAILADGSQVQLRTYSCSIEWFGEDRLLEVVANAGEYPLLGVGLLMNRQLRIDYQSAILEIQ